LSRDSSDRDTVFDKKENPPGFCIRLVAKEADIFYKNSVFNLDCSRVVCREELSQKVEIEGEIGSKGRKNLHFFNPSRSPRSDDTHPTVVFVTWRSRVTKTTVGDRSPCILPHHRRSPRLIYSPATDSGAGNSVQTS
jgi:hypothetical protein